MEKKKNLIERISLAIKAFNEADFLVLPDDPEDFEDFDARRLQNQIYWAAYDGTLYRNIHKWAQALRNRYGLYRYTRSPYTPATRLANFYKTMLWGGLLDFDDPTKGAIPIKPGESMKDQAAEAISSLWLKSNLGTRKNVCTLWGASLGDVGFKVVDDPDKEEVRIELVHPSTIADIETDSSGYIRGYELTEERYYDGTKHIWSERASREVGSDKITYEIFMDGKPHPWGGEKDTWEETYGFVPFVVAQHNDVGMNWGLPEIHTGFAKMLELDDIASKFHDQIRKLQDPPWLANFSKPKSTPEMAAEDADTDKPQPGREEIYIIYANNPAAKMQALTGDMNLDAVSVEIQNMVKELERDYPELQMDIWSADDNVSGRALKKAQQRVERKVQERRAGYDDALRRVHQMALSIGAMNNYDGYGGLTAESFEKGELDHMIDPNRPVFDADEAEMLEVKKLFWETVKNAVDSGVALETALRDLGWDDKQLKDYGIQRLADIKLKQEDKIPEIDPETSEPMEQ